MDRAGRSERLPLLVLVLGVLFVLVVVGGCGTGTEVSEVDTLRQRFPEQASKLLEGGAPFAATDEGFVVVRPPGTSASHGVRASMPRQLPGLRGSFGDTIRA